MLQDGKPHGFIDEIQPATFQQDGLAELVYSAIGLLRRQYVVILLAAVLGLGAGAIYLSIATPIYTAQTNLYIDLHRNPLGQQPGVFGNDPIEIESQIQIIKSKSIASSVIKKFQLDGTGFTPGVKGSMEHLIAAFENNMTVEHVGGRVIAIKFNSTSPDRAAQVANAVANAYITDQLEAKYQANRVATNWLQERQQQLREQADAAQRAVDSFKKQNDIITTDGGKPLDSAQLADLNSRLVAARAQTSDVLARADRLQEIVRVGPSDTIVDGVISEITSPIATTLRQQYLELERREKEWSARYGKDHLAVVNLRNRMHEIRASLFDELRQAAATAKNDYEIAKQRQEEIEKQLASIVAQSRSTSQVQVTLSALESAATASRKLYDGFLQQYMGSTQLATFPITEARVISAAAPPLQRSKPRTTLVIPLSLLGGIGLGVGLSILRDLMDRVFRTAKQLEAELQVPCVALVPMVKNALLLKNEEVKHQAITNYPKSAPHEAAVFRTVVNSPLSSFAEAIRSIKLTIDLQLDARPCKVIGFTSTLPNEGKSTIAAALAHLIGQVGGRVLLVDCDLRNPTLSRMLARDTAIGVFDIVSKKVSFGEAILKEPKSNVSFLPAGKKIPQFLTSETLGGDSINKLFETLRQNYNYILVDLPPLSPIVDVRASAHFVDAYLLTVEWGHTKIDAVEQSLRSAPRIYDNLIGTVLNKTDMDTIARYDSSGRYDRNSHYSRYGYTD